LETISINEANLAQEFKVNYIAKQASGSVMLKVGKAVVVASVARDDSEVDGDFVPLTVQYIEKTYANAKIPGGFIKREAKPSEFETLTSRVIDRSLRPLFPSNYRFNTSIAVLVVSSDENVDMQVVGLNAASAALYLSDCPVEKIINGARVAKLDGQTVVNPSLTDIENSTLDLYVSGSKDELLMIEMKSIASKNENGEQLSNALNSSQLVDELENASNAIAQLATATENALKPFAKPSIQMAQDESAKVNEEIVGLVKSNYNNDMLTALSNMAKSERNVELKNLANKIFSDVEEKFEQEEILKAVEAVKKETVRNMIVNEGKRADGRGLKDVRPISIETNILPSVHGSCLFTRGQTQALVTATLGNDKDAQMYETLTSKDPKFENFMVHYNFYGFSVGEAKYIGAPGRRELGHGNLGKRALEPLNDIDQKGTVRLVSEILESNGSSSMATICGGSLAMRAAGVQTKDLVAGIAMGLILEDGKHAVLSDILGLEDHDGDMDFKVAGTTQGITALQMDIKLGGVSKEILQEALIQAEEGRNHILGLMQKANDEIVLNEDVLPAYTEFAVEKSNVAKIIGKGGENIKKIIEQFSVSIDLERDSGLVQISGESKAGVAGAKEYIKSMFKPPVEVEVGEVYSGKVSKVLDFGAFIDLEVGTEGLLHISKISSERIKDIKEHVSVGDEIQVKVLGQKGHKIELQKV
jgi:polyribonucleotide nucleotidyltransferase